MEEEQVKQGNINQQQAFSNFFHYLIKGLHYKNELIIDEKSSTSIPKKLIQNEINKIVPDCHIFIKDSFIYSPSQQKYPEQIKFFNEDLDIEQIFRISPQQETVLDKEEKQSLVKSIINRAFENNFEKFVKVSKKYFMNPMDLVKGNSVIQRSNQIFPAYKLDFQNIFEKNYISLKPAPLIIQKCSLTDLILQLKKQYSDIEIKKILIGQKVKFIVFENQQIQFYKINDILFEESANTFKNPQNKVLLKDQLKQEFNLISEQIETDIVLVLTGDKNEKFMLGQFCNLIVDEVLVRENKNIFLEQLDLQEDLILQANEMQKLSHYLQWTNKDLQNFVNFLSFWKIQLINKGNQLSVFYQDPGQLILRNQEKNKLGVSLKQLNDAKQKLAFISGFKNVFGLAFLEKIEFKQLGLFYHQVDEELAKNFQRQLQILGSSYEYDLGECLENVLDSYIQRDWLLELENFVQESMDLVIVILPKLLNNETFYRRANEIVLLEKKKPLLILEQGTQIDPENVEVQTKQILAQISSIQGQSPWHIASIPFSENPTVVIGINLKKNNLTGQIIVGISMSWNQYFTKYLKNFWVSDSKDTKEEIILIEMKKILLEMLKEFVSLNKVVQNNNNKKKPVRNIIVFRHEQDYSIFKKEKSTLEETVTQFNIEHEQKAELILITSNCNTKTSIYMQNIPGYINNNSIESIGNGALIPFDNDKNNFIFKFKNTPVYYNILKSNKNQNQNIVNFIYKLHFLNFDLNLNTFLPAPAQHAFNLTLFIYKISQNLNSLEEEQQNQFELINLNKELKNVVYYYHPYNSY